VDRASVLSRMAGALLHVDASQSAGRLAIDVEASRIDALSVSSHKLYGPPGIGALYISPDARGELRPLFFGGGQQSGLRPGTVPVFLAVGFGIACALAKERIESDRQHVEKVAERFCLSLSHAGVKFRILGQKDCRLPGLRSLQLEGVDGDDLATRLAAEVAVSTGSACSAGTLKGSRVLSAMGLSDGEASQVVRVGFGRDTTLDDAESAASIMAGKIHRILAS
jgi:cysteine desulfurase